MQRLQSRLHRFDSGRRLLIVLDVTIIYSRRGQVALLVPFLAALIGLLASFRMIRVPDPRIVSSAWAGGQPGVSIQRMMRPSRSS
jgi:hypothetical protein